MSGNPATVLIIESHPMMRAAICSAIADEPDLTIGAVASNGADTFKLVENLRPNVILFAVGNPGETDLAVLKEMRQKFPGQAILALTSAEVEGQEQAALECGADAAVTKLVQRAELLSSLRKLQNHSPEAGNSTSERSVPGSE